MKASFLFYSNIMEKKERKKESKKRKKKKRDSFAYCAQKKGKH